MCDLDRFSKIQSQIMNNNRPPASFFQKIERETGNQVSLALGTGGCTQKAEPVRGVYP